MQRKSMMPAPLLRPHVPLGSKCSIAVSLARLRGTSNECEAAIAASWHDFMPLLPGCINPVLQPRCVFSDIALAGRGALSQSPVRSTRGIAGARRDGDEHTVQKRH
jgi:hypothetical protein